MTASHTFVYYVMYGESVEMKSVEKSTVYV
jgi:hypothetical protein